MAAPDESTPMHEQRHRAEVFGSAAEAYEQFRPSYPGTLVDELVATAPSRALDIGCGTGKAGRLLAARGVDVLGVEIDEDMAEVARRSGLDVEVGPFETWDPAGRTFDLAISGQAWHWIDPALGVPKVAGLLRPGGTLALFWNTTKLENATRALLLSVYERHGSGVEALGRGVDDDDPPYAEDLRRSGLFASVQLRKYPWTQTYTSEQYVRLVQTYSDQLVRPAGERAAMADGLVAALDAAGGSVVVKYVTLAILANAPR